MKLLIISSAAVIAAVALANTPAAAASLTIGDVSASQVSCTVANHCDSVGTTTSVNLQYYMQGKDAQVMTRTLQGLPGGPLAGKTVYQYQIDLTAVAVNGGSECLVGMVFGFSAIDAVNYGSGRPTDLYVITSGITSGSPGTIAPSGANLIEPGLVEVDFNPPVCAGQASEPFGLASSQGFPAVSDIRLLQPGPIPIVDVSARIPSGSIGMAAPSPPTNLRVIPQ
jgi:hypothetical protein